MPTTCKWLLCISLVLVLDDDSRAEGAFRCAAKLVQGVPGVTGGATGTRGTVAIFARFNDGGGPVVAPSWAQELFDAERPGSISHFYDEMSFGRLRLRGDVAPRRYVARDPAGAYLALESGERGDFARFSREILEQADHDLDFSRYDDDGPDGIPNSGDDDGLVDAVFVVVDSTPENFLIGAATGIATLGVHFITDDPGADGRPIEIREGTLQLGRTFAETAGTICHEYAHLLELPDLYDVAFIRSGSTDPEGDSAGIGNWGLMAWGALGWRGDDGPAAFSAWSRMRLGWAELEAPVQLNQEMRIDPVATSGKVYQVPLPNGEFFLLEYRTRGGTFYDRNIPAEGLLIWHVGGTSASEVDLECADGRFFDAGYPLGSQVSPEFGGDNLDFWSRDADYNRTFAGNLGDATDPFDGLRFAAFTPETNPDALSSDREWDARVENIRVEGGKMVADVTTSPVVRISQVRVLDENRDGIWVVGETAELYFDLTTRNPSGVLRTILTEIDSLAESTRASANYEIDPGSRYAVDNPTGYMLATAANQLILRDNFAGSGRIRMRVEVQEPVGEGWLQLWSEEVELLGVAMRQTVADVVVIDTLGNGDGLLQAGEIFRLGLALDLDEPAVLQGLDLRLRSLAPDVVRLSGGQLSFRRPNRYDQRSVDGPEFLVGGAIVAGELLDFELTVQSGFGHWRDTLQVAVAAGPDRTAPRVLGVKARSRAQGLQVWLPDELILEGGGIERARVRIFAADGAERLADLELARGAGEWRGIWSGAWPGTEYFLQAAVADTAGNEGRSHRQRVAVPVPGERRGDRQRMDAGDARLEAVALAANGRWAALAAGPEVRVYDGVEPVHVLPAADVQALAFDTDGELVAAGGRAVRVWSVVDGSERAVLAGPAGGAAALAFNQLGELAVGGADGQVAIWDIVAGRMAESLSVPSGAAVRAVAFSNNGRYLAAGTADAEVVLWTGRQRIVETLLGHRGQVESVSFSPDGDWLASGGRAGQVRVWNLGRAARGRALGGVEAWVRAVSFSADGKWLAAGRRDGRIAIWDRAGFQQVAELDTGSGIEGMGFGGVDTAARLLAATWEGAWLLDLSLGQEDVGASGLVTFPAYPNPFNGEVRIPYQLVAGGRVVLQIYDALGQLVRRLDLGQRPAGYYYGPGRAAQWDGLDQSGHPAASGLYFYTLHAGGTNFPRKIVLIR